MSRNKPDPIEHYLVNIVAMVGFVCLCSITYSLKGGGNLRLKKDLPGPHYLVSVFVNIDLDMAMELDC